MLCAGAGTERLWPRARACAASSTSATTFAGAAATAGVGRATWADRSERFGARTYGVADGPGRFALGLAELDAQPAPADAGRRRRRAAAGPRARCARGCTRTRARRSPGSGRRSTRSSRLLTVLPGDDEDATVIERAAQLIVVAGHNLFKLAPLLGEEVADATM